MRKVEPISPDNIVAPLREFPDEVIEAFNELITKKWNGEQSKIQQNEIINLISEKTGHTKEYIFAEKLLDVEPNFEKSGWSVAYYKGAYFETWEPYFIFKKGK